MRRVVYKKQFSQAEHDILRLLTIIWAGSVTFCALWFIMFGVFWPLLVIYVVSHACHRSIWYIHDDSLLGYYSGENIHDFNIHEYRNERAARLRALGKPITRA